VKQNTALPSASKNAKTLHLEFSHLIVIQSLEPGEFQTGRELFNYLQVLDSKQGKLFFKEVNSAKEFVERLREIVEWTTSTKMRPWLHIECHASAADGLFFENASELSWSDLCEELRPLNRASDFNLMVGASACYGSHLAQGMLVTQPAPCFGVLGPTDVVDPGDLLGHFRAFYREILVNKSLDSALASWSNFSLAVGAMGMVSAEDWWESLCNEFLQEHFSPNNFKSAVKSLYRRLKEGGRHPHIVKLTRLHYKKVPETMRQYFDSYFMVEHVPACAERFMDKRNSMENVLRQSMAKLKIA